MRWYLIFTGLSFIIFGIVFVGSYFLVDKVLFSSWFWKPNVQSSKLAMIVDLDRPVMKKEIVNEGKTKLGAIFREEIRKKDEGNFIMRKDETISQTKQEKTADQVQPQQLPQPSPLQAQQDSIPELRTESQLQQSEPMVETKIEVKTDPVSEPVGNPDPIPAVEDKGRVFINEILFDAEGSDAGKEFVELRNTKTSEVNLDGWSLKLETDLESNSLVKFGSKKQDVLNISAGGLFLTGFSGYNGQPVAQVVRSSSLPNKGGKIVLLDANSVEVDSVTYLDAPEAGKSWARKEDGSWEWQILTAGN